MYLSVSCTEMEAENGESTEAGCLASLVYTVANKKDPLSNNVGGKDSHCRLALEVPHVPTLSHSNKHIECTHIHTHKNKHKT